MSQIKSFLRNSNSQYNIEDTEEEELNSVENTNVEIFDSDEDLNQNTTSSTVTETIIIESDESDNEKQKKCSELIFNTYPRPKKYTGMNVNNLRSLQEIPAQYRKIFAGYANFNDIQSKVFNDVLYTDKQIVVSAPTGSGKTVIFELAIIQLLLKLEDVGNHNNFKIIYSPIKALCAERFVDWCTKFKPLGIECLEVTGDSDITDLKELEQYKILLSTPEKWDSLTRRWRENEELVKTIYLFLIDEVHLVNEDKRGPILEAVVSRMKTINSTFNRLNDSTTYCHLRFIAVSATIPNIEDIACWFGGKEAVYHKMSEESRPIILKKYVIGYKAEQYSTSFRFDMSLNYRLTNVIKKYSVGKPTMVFCSTRKGVEMAATVLNANLSMTLNDHQKNILRNLSLRFIDIKLKDLIIKGIAFHHAGLLPEDRSYIEEMFRDGKIPVLLCTSTLAMGVNLPANLVIIKSTQNYTQGSSSEYSESTILQMIGRAGRPQFDTSGTAVIMTQDKNVIKYEKLVNGTSPVESHLHKYIAEHINAEIVLKTITNLSIAMDWIRSTFLYVRAIKNPSNYGLSQGLCKEKIEKKLEEMCLIGINSLEKHGLIIKNQSDGLTITSTVYGKLMARYYLNFNTMKLFRKINGNETLIELLLILSKCHEFSEYTLRVSDKRILNELNKSNEKKVIRFPINGKIKSINDKVNCIMQAVLGGLQIGDSSLSQEATKIVRLAVKISKSMADCVRVSEKNSVPTKFNATLNSLILAKCFYAKLWENSPYISRQLKKIGPTYSTLLANAGKITFQSLIETDPRELERIVNKNPPFGNELIDGALKIPKYEIKIIIHHVKLGRITVQQTNQHYESVIDKVAVIIGDTFNNLLYFEENIQLLLEEDNIFEKMFRIINTESPHLYGHVIHHSLVGVDEFIQVDTGIPIDIINTPLFKTQTAKIPNVNNSSIKLTKKVTSLNNKDDSTKKISDYFKSKPTQSNTRLQDIRKQLDFGNENNKFGTVLYKELNTIPVESMITKPYVNSNFKQKLNDYRQPEKPKITLPTDPNYEIIEILDKEKNNNLKSHPNSNKCFTIFRNNNKNQIKIDDETRINLADGDGRSDKFLDIGIDELMNENSSDDEDTKKHNLIPTTPSLSKFSLNTKQISIKNYKKSLEKICDENCLIVKNNTKLIMDNLRQSIHLSDDNDDDDDKEFNIKKNYYKRNSNFMCNNDSNKTAKSVVENEADITLVTNSIINNSPPIIPSIKNIILPDPIISSTSLPKIIEPPSNIFSSKQFLPSCSFNTNKFYEETNIFILQSTSSSRSSSLEKLQQTTTDRKMNSSIDAMLQKIQTESNIRLPPPPITTATITNNNSKLNSLTKRPRDMTMHIKRDCPNNETNSRFDVDDRIKRRKYLNHCNKIFEESERNGLNKYKKEDYLKHFVYLNVADLSSSCESRHDHNDITTITKESNIENNIDQFNIKKNINNNMCEEDNLLDDILNFDCDSPSFENLFSQNMTSNYNRENTTKNINSFF